ncbi:MAG TPA: undecaprenyl-diphosphate phosphatase [Steroidobacteraceae bacterium]|nr:undecaprenyl-diphosphate phosphatase [Steroidobacteraceae bacterium]
MQFWQLAILAIVQGLAELLPVSSSAHVIVAEKLLGLDPTSPQMTLLLVMLHTGTMFAVIVYFWRSWREAYFSSVAAFRDVAVRVIVATALTGSVGLALMYFIKHAFMNGASDFQIESLFGNAHLMGAALAAVGILIITAGLSRRPARDGLTVGDSAVIGVMQGVCLPFRGFSRSGATISTGMLLGVARRRAEEFSFALAVVLTPPVIVRELHRLHKAQALAGGSVSLGHAALPSLAGMVLSFLAGMVALRWLSRWLEAGRWHLFGAYCLVAAAVVWWIG